MKAVEADLKAAQEQQEKAKEDFDNNPNAESRKSFGQAKRKVGNLSKDLLALEKQRKKEQKVPRPQERWVRECRKAFPSDKMRRNEVVFEDKALLQKLRSASEMRTRRAHMEPPSEAEVVDALGIMKAILLQCKLETAAQKILGPMEKAQQLFENAIEAASNESKSSACDTTSELLSATDWKALVLYRALSEFETQLEHKLCHIPK
eukprot:IDg1029t1